ncbi:SDR family oxidoreductase [Janibacter cremeus]|uniref:3-oxoacyl-[acyl-carrier protein] reductase n=1 Tax=Janibacter cremeus TaxID=1285192 RepID=A0A852VK62_9MICO|nr:SDR family oxidoreductase [Janibacter cremeus]NYF97452.1 3-oxoacyl-[acyl-carrier protein] reductase [Janibacter cremeus]
MSFTTTTRSTALVLAGSKGLGYGCASRLAEDGHDVALCARSAESAEAAASTLAAHTRSLGVAADVSDPEQLHEAVERVRTELGPISVLVANAGGPPAGGFEALADESWETAYQLTLMSFVRCVREVLPDMRALGGGRIILIGSSSVRRPIPNLTLSNTFRPALNGLVKDLAIDLAADNVTVNVVAPGRVDTDRVRQLDLAGAERTGRTAEEVRAASEGSIPMGRYGRVEEFAALVGFLASEAASYVTGQTILVDGGLTASLP